MKLQSFFQFATLLFFVALLPFGSLNAQRSIRVEGIQEKLAGIDLKMGLNLVDELPDGYHIGLVMKSGSPNQWVTVAPDGKTTKPVTKALDKEYCRGNIMTWKCTFTSQGWVCVCVGNCDF